MKSSTNCLLTKDDVGRGKPSARDLPPNYHTFGYQNKGDTYGVKDCKYQLQASVSISTLNVIDTSSDLTHSDEHLANPQHKKEVAPQWQKLQTPQQDGNS